MPNRHQDWLRQALSDLKHSKNACDRVRFPDHEGIKTSLRMLAEQVLQEEPNVVAVYLFGSRAAGNHSARSDADLLVLLRDDPLPPIDRIPRFLQLFRRAPVPVDIFPYTLAEAERIPFAQRALRQAVLLCQR